MIYFIPEWDKHFETAKSRTFKKCSNVHMPNKQDGLGFTRIIALPDGAAIFGIWCLIVQACSRQSPPRQGYLTDTGVSSGCPWTIRDLAMRWRRTDEEIQRAVDILSSQAVGWLSVYESTDTTRIPQGYHTDTSGSLDLIRLDKTRLDSESKSGVVEIDPDEMDGVMSPATQTDTPGPPAATTVSFNDWVMSGHGRVAMDRENRSLWETLWRRLNEEWDGHIPIMDAMYSALVKTLDNPRHKIFPTSADEWIRSHVKPR